MFIGVKRSLIAIKHFVQQSRIQQISDQRFHLNDHY